MTIQQIRERVSSKVKEKLVPNLLDKLVELHASRKPRDCDCNYCSRLKTLFPAFRRSYGHHLPVGWRDELKELQSE